MKVPLLPVEMCQIIGLKDYIHYHMTNIANKYYESLEDWEKFTAKNFVRFRVNIAPALPPNAAPSAQVTKPPPVINDPFQDWKKAIKHDMSTFKEMKRTKEWEQWDTKFRANITTQGLSNLLDPNYIPATYDDKMLLREQQHYMYAVFIHVLKTDKGKALELDQVCIETFKPTNGKGVDNEGFYATWARSQGGEMWAQSWGTLPVVDCADKSCHGHNMTVTMKHGIEYAPCKKILEVHDSLTGITDNMTLYFAVPDWITDSIGKQSSNGVKKWRMTTRTGFLIGSISTC